MCKLVLIFVGSGLGGVLRYALGGWGQRLADGRFPLGTLIVNVSGCLLIRFLTAAFAGRVLIREEYRVALLIGVLGGYTTFSTFGLETLLSNTLSNRRHEKGASRQKKRSADPRPTPSNPAEPPPSSPNRPSARCDGYWVRQGWIPLCVLAAWWFSSAPFAVDWCPWNIWKADNPSWPRCRPSNAASRSSSSATMRTARSSPT
jgi:CrcB protein